MSQKEAHHYLERCLGLARQIEILEFALCATSIGCWEWDLVHSKVRWFGSMEKLFGFAPGSFNGTMEHAGLSIHPDDRDKISKEIDRCLVNRTDYAQEYRLVLPDGAIRWIRSSGRTAFDAFGKPLRIIGTALDVTDEMQAEEVLVAAKISAEVSNAHKTAFLANMSHEIRAPLGVILGFAELMADPTLTGEERDEYMGVIARNGEHLSRLIDDALDLSKIEAGRLEVQRSIVNVQNVIDEVVRSAEERALKNETEVKRFFLGKVPQKIFIDPVRFRQIILNLVHNAVKFTERGEVLITVSCESRHSDFCVRVQDTGIGISSRGQSRLFRPFSQVDSSSRKFGGTGLGLALSRRLAKAMGGDLVLVHSLPGCGSAFEFRLPHSSYQIVSQGPQEKPDLELNSGSNPEQMRPPKEKMNLSGIRILLADDSLDNQFLMNRLLRKTGAELVVVGDGEQALSRVRREHFDLVLMDIQMPKMDGYKATQCIRQESIKVPIIALTAHAMIDEKEKSLQAGCDAHLSKPVRPAILFETIQSCLPEHS